MNLFAPADAALLGSAFLMGLAGSLHCALMCGAAFAAITGRAGAPRIAGRTTAAMSLHAGRLISYAAAGALVATGVAALGTLQSAAPLLRPLWTGVHVGAIALGLWLIVEARAPAWLSAASARVPAFVAGSGRLAVQGGPRGPEIKVVRWLPAASRSGIVGLCWAGMPCGLLQSALLVAALASGPLPGAAVMAAFAASSALGLWLGPRLWSGVRAAGRGERWAAWSTRLAGGLLAGSSLFALWHGLGAAIAAAICRVVLV